MTVYNKSPNKPAAGKAGIARPLTIEHHCPGLPEPARCRNTNMHMYNFALFALVVLLGVAALRSQGQVSRIAVWSDWSFGLVAANGCIDAFGKAYPGRKYFQLGPVAFELSSK